jgi:hypothetical protein
MRIRRILAVMMPGIVFFLVLPAVAFAMAILVNRFFGP